ncbi:hypothetical protein GCM10010124_09140 [Pilimelia terevasa]|uniref:Uncharacterized protein n=1 Tax=Pilimelia terevasa TaxID=53372 RepID=A0A8J3BPK6_9ACTN|nr:hypothetical protein [Pilimelia terevasa]GGK18710.1 hypothetical protein GCM10010124_09140 [Pilimelia terevasa]
MRSHRTDALSLVFALFFLAGAAWWTLGRQLDVRLPAAGWFVAGGVALFGLLGLMAALRRGRETAAVPVAGTRTDARVETDDERAEEQAGAE